MVSRDQRGANLQKMIREEIRRTPEGLGAWVGRRWMAEHRWMFCAVAISCFAVQGFAAFLNHLLAGLAEIPTLGGSTPESHDVVRWVMLSSLVTIIFTIEGIGWASHDLPSLSRFAVRPLSPWGLWKEIQWFGLLRIPRVLVYASPFLVVPTLVMEESRQLPLLTLAFSLTSLFVVRTLVVASFVNETSCTFLPLWIGALAVPCLLFFGMPLMFFGVAASLPVEGFGFRATLRQGALQAASISFFGFSAVFWYFAARSPKEG